ncbi:tRNA(Ser) Um(44) 2'-O-methyltransferase [Penicillium atrosanguineum]|uniref:tRNA (uracil-O(2)-)-methyltransferase n=1 Tax=Penicillium atrosanguineum TaxID=1132637 RepID=A0A9W9Q2F2_9EURO|nr:tRNA(Ser) Um(44) 2'-O-methyltransferase [Penicillium atrosanguineum]
MPNRKNTRDLTKLSGKPLIETMRPSALKMDSEGWLTSPDLHEHDLHISSLAVYDTAIFLMANPNVTSSHLFRADILHDSLCLLNTIHENGDRIPAKPATKVEGFELIRTVVLFLEPQMLFIKLTSRVTPIACLSCTPPHVSAQEEMPFYHPLVKSLAYLYRFDPYPGTGAGTMSIHFLPFTPDIPNRLERTLHVLLNFNIRLAQQSKANNPQDQIKDTDQGSFKDNVVPRHIVQDTYARLKTLYAKDLCDRWVEKTEPSKHVFEDLAIAAFLIELWRLMYDIDPPKEKTTTPKQEKATAFQSFVDVACGNGVLVYVLLMEGYSGCGFDARRRKTWGIFPISVQEHLSENIYIPKPFADALGPVDIGVKTHTGDFLQGTFIISNHADELTVWTPLMAALACPESPLPFLSIPCCSHSLAGSRYRYPPPKKSKGPQMQEAKPVEQNPQPTSGDLRALRAAKDKEKTGDGMLNSMYGSLTAKTMSIAEEIGYEVEKTQLRIPSTRNFGVVGARQLFSPRRRNLAPSNLIRKQPGEESTELVQRINSIVERECAMEGGIQTSARMWIERAHSLHEGPGMGNQAHS